MHRTARSVKWFVVSLAALVAFAGEPLILSGASSAAFAQEKKKDDSKAPMKGKQSQTLSKRVYELISEANELVDVEDFAGARALLDKVAAMPKLSSYEMAQLNSFYGFLYFNSEEYAKAKQSYEKVLAQPDLPEGLKQQTYRTLAQLSFATEDFNGAIKYAQDYMAETGPDGDMYAIIGTAYYQIASEKGDRATKDDYRKIIAPVQAAIDLSAEQAAERRAAGQDDGGKGIGKEQWWLLLRVAYWELDDYNEVKGILETLVVNWPKKEYWTQLSGIYYELKNEQSQLAAYEAAYDQGLLTKSAELMQLAQLFIQADVPFKGARVLEKGFQAELVERKERNLRLYSQAWQLSQEYERAIAPLEEAAGMSDDGELYARLAQSHLNLSEYKSCVTAANKGLQKGKLKNTGNAYLILGMCQAELGQLESAKATFVKATKYEKVAKNARSWIDYVSSEQSRIEQLERSLQQAEEYLRQLDKAIEEQQV